MRSLYYVFFFQLFLSTSSKVFLKQNKSGHQKLSNLQLSWSLKSWWQFPMKACWQLTSIQSAVGLQSAFKQDLIRGKMDRNDECTCVDFHARLRYFADCLSVGSWASRTNSEHSLRSGIDIFLIWLLVEGVIFTIYEPQKQNLLILWNEREKKKYQFCPGTENSLFA